MPTAPVVGRLTPGPSDVSTGLRGVSACWEPHGGGRWQPPASVCSCPLAEVLCQLERRGAEGARW